MLNKLFLTPLADRRAGKLNSAAALDSDKANSQPGRDTIQLDCLHTIEGAQRLSQSKTEAFAFRCEQLGQYRGEASFCQCNTQAEEGKVDETVLGYAVRKRQ